MKSLQPPPPHTHSLADISVTYVINVSLIAVGTLMVGLQLSENNLLPPIQGVHTKIVPVHDHLPFLLTLVAKRYFLRELIKSKVFATLQPTDQKNTQMQLVTQQFSTKYI